MNRTFSLRRLLIKPMTRDEHLIGLLKKCHSHSDEPVDRPTRMLDSPDLVPRLDGSETSWINKDASNCQILDSGMILLKDYISVMGQANIVNTCRHLGLGPDGFYLPSNRYGYKLRLHMTCFGRNWDPTTGYETSREPPPLIPIALVNLAKAVVKDTQAHVQLPSMCPDVCVANCYQVFDRLGLHQDCDESSDSLTRGLPVVSISIGHSAEFWYGHTRDMNKLHKVILDTGDALVFGGKSRLIFHGVRNTLASWSSVPAMQALRINGRLNLTFRQF